MKRTLYLYFPSKLLVLLMQIVRMDSLLKVLDKVIERLIYTQKRSYHKRIKEKKVGLNSLEDIHLNKETTINMKPLFCDSAEQYIQRILT